MERNEGKELWQELTQGDVVQAMSVAEVRTRPGVIAEVDEETYFFYLEMLFPRWMGREGVCFGEGVEPYLLFWRKAGRHFVRQLTMEETQRFARIVGTL